MRSPIQYAYLIGFVGHSSINCNSNTTGLNWRDRLIVAPLFLSFFLKERSNYWMIYVARKNYIMNTRVLGGIVVESRSEYKFMHRACCAEMNLYTHRCRIIHPPSCLRRRLGKNTYLATMPYMNYVFNLAIIELRDFAHEICLYVFSHYTGSALCYCSSLLTMNTDQSVCFSFEKFAETHTVK